MDGTGDNSPYAIALAQAIQQPGKSLVDVFIDVTQQVKRVTKNSQDPWYNASLSENIYLAGASVAPEPAASSEEENFWRRIRDKRDGKYFEIYLEQYPEGAHAEAARAKLAGPKTSSGSTLSLAAFTGYLQDKWQGFKSGNDPAGTGSHAETLPDKVIERQGQLTIHAQPSDAVIKILNIVPPLYQAGMVLAPGEYHIQVSKAGYQTQDQWIKLGAEASEIEIQLAQQVGPNIEMVAIQPGCFQMGSPSSETGRDADERQHQVCIK